MTRENPYRKAATMASLAQDSIAAACASMPIDAFFNLPALVTQMAEVFELWNQVDIKLEQLARLEIAQK